MTLLRKVETKRKIFVTSIFFQLTEWHFYWKKWLSLKLWELYVDVSDAMRVGSQKGIFEVRKFLYSQRVSNFSLSLTSFLWWVDFFWIFTNFTPNHNYSSLICLIRQNKIWYSVSHNSIAPPDFSGNHGNHKNWVPALLHH